jgi:hypothetical protein
MPTWEIPPVTITRSITVQDEVQVFGDPRTDLLTASLAVTRDGRTLTTTATLRQPTSPTTPNWWRGWPLPRPGISWGMNIHPDSTSWDFVARLRGDPDLGAYGFVQRYQDGSHTLACQANAAFDGDLYQLQFPSACLGSPVRIRFTAAMHLYDDSGQDLLGGDYAPGHGGEAMSDWLNMPVLAPPS